MQSVLFCILATSQFWKAVNTEVDNQINFSEFEKFFKVHADKDEEFPKVNPDKKKTTVTATTVRKKNHRSFI